MVIAFAMGDDDERSGQIRISAVRLGLAINVVEEALRRSQSENDGAIAQWLMKAFKSEEER